MHQNIKINNTKSLDAKLYSAKYYDFMLYKGKVADKKYELKDLSIVDLSDLNIINGKLYSNVVWSGATNKGVLLKDIGLTGMDNGFIQFRKDRITNEDFVNLLTKSKFSIESGDTRFFLTPVTGNTQMYNYPIFLYEDTNDKYISCQGGFYQGFFKLHGHDYEVIPNRIKNEWTMHFNLRPRSDYKITDSLINYTHPNNNGIFFFMGIRAENKFWPFYKTDEEFINSLKKQDAQTEGYFSGCGESGETYNITENNVVNLENEWLSDEIIEEVKHTHDSYFAEGDDYFLCEYAEKLKPSTTSFITTSKEYISTNDVNCECDSYYMNNDYYNNECQNNFKKAIEDDYVGKGVEINKYGYEDSAGHQMNYHGYQDLVSDNKFLLFDRTSTGFTINNWIEGSKITITTRKKIPGMNYFLLFNRTATGYTKETIQEYDNANEVGYNIHKDIRNNVFALRIREDGAIGYRYGVYDCNSENNYRVIEEYSKPNMIKYDEWNKINVRFRVIDPFEDDCNKWDKKMKIYFYIDKHLIFVSKEVNAFNFKNIEDECFEKQECVPYNISLGGGSLGLLETILPNYYAVSEYIFPIERDFCGSFMGDIKSFKMYNGEIDYSTIVNYLS